MDETLLQELRAATHPPEKAAWIAERILNGLPANLADVVRRCVILHWFNLPIVEALSKDTSIADNEVNALYEQLASLPFIERLPWGLAFHDLTREGLLQRYASTQPELLHHAASVAAPAYEALAHNEKMVAEAVFCYIIAGNQETAERVLNRLLETACNRENWQYIDNLFYLQRDAEQLPFVKPLPRSEQRHLLQDLVYAVQGSMQAYAIHTQNDLLKRKAYAYVSQGIQFAYQNHFKKAIANFTKALQLAPNFAPAYVSRGIVFERQENYELALQDFTSALAVNPDNTFLLQKKGNALNELARYEEALAVYEQLLHLDPQNAADYVGKGNALIGLEKHVEALVVYDQAIHLNPHSAAAYAGKGKALSRLKRYSEAHIAFEQAQQEDISIHIEAIEVSNISKAKNPLQKRKSLRESATSPARRGKVPTAAASLLPSLYRQNSLALRRERWLAFPVVAVLIGLSALLFSVVHLNTTTGGNVGATATVEAQANATATARAPTNGNANPTAVVQANATATAEAQFSRLDYSPHRLTLQNVDYNGLLINSPSAVEDVAQQVRSQIPQGENVGLAIVYDGTPDASGIALAQEVGAKVEGVLRKLGQEGFTFSNASYYDPLYTLGADHSVVEIDVFFVLNTKNTSAISRLDPHYTRLTLQNVDYNGLLNNSQTAINDLEQQVRSQISQGKSVGFAIVYDGALTTGDIGTAVNIDAKVYQTLRDLGNQGFAFEKASYYDQSPLYTLGPDHSSVTIDVFFLV